MEEIKCFFSFTMCKRKCHNVPNHNEQSLQGTLIYLCVKEYTFSSVSRTQSACSRKTVNSSTTWSKVVMTWSLFFLGGFSFDLFELLQLLQLTHTDTFEKDNVINLPYQKCNY